MAKQKLTYTEATTELEEILADLENNGDISMDVIADKVKRAAILLKSCKKQLHELDVEMEKIIKDLDI
jgi:exodeoxyribonuclease VII small subunit